MDDYDSSFPFWSAAVSLMSASEVAADCAKKSFLQIPVAIEIERLVDEFNRIPDNAWGVSHWDVHCSIDVLLLRGGTKGEAEDYITEHVQNAPILCDLPYISSLLLPEGPFGGAKYAVIFRTKPRGITRAHYDDDQAWHRTVRIHIPIVTNKDAYLIVEGMAKHLEVGQVWTFDNQTRHSVVNGDSTRVHMIFDVQPNPKLAKLMKRATFDPGRPAPDLWALTGGPDIVGGDTKGAYVFASGKPLTIMEKKELGLDPDGFATRITRVSRIGRLMLVPIKKGDVLLAVNDVHTSLKSRSALDHLRLQHEPGETVVLDVLRAGARRKFKVQLKRDSSFSWYRRFTGLVRKVGNGFRHV